MPFLIFRLDTVPVEEDRIEMMEKLEQTAPCYIRDCALGNGKYSAGSGKCRQKMKRLT